MRILKIFIICTGITLITACNLNTDTRQTSEITEETPVTVLKDFFQQLANNNMDSAAQLTTVNSRPTMNMLKMALQMTNADSLAASARAQLQDAGFGDTRIKEDSAFVTVSSKSNKQAPVEFILLQENNTWKVDFTTAALTRIGNNAMKQPQNFDTALLNRVDLNKAKKMADSLMKNLDPAQLKEIENAVKDLYNK